MANSKTAVIGPGIVAIPARQSVVRGRLEVLLSATQFQILMLVAQATHGITPEHLFNALYAHRPDGGPDTGRRAVCVQRIITNRKLKPLGIRITSTGHGRAGGFYELKPAQKGDPL